MEKFLENCMLCELRCGTDRLSGEVGRCGVGASSWCFKHHLSFSEELALLPSYMVYFGGCNFRCAFCVQSPDSFSAGKGIKVVPTEFAQILKDAAASGAKTINLLGGEPSLHLVTIRALASELNGTIPLVLNSNMYMTPEWFDLARGSVSIYLADFKFGPGACADRIAGVPHYFETVTRNLKIAAEGARAQVMVRHLLMPGHDECCLKPIQNWMRSEMPGTSLNIMTGYVPAGRLVTQVGLSGEANNVT
ncbi:MAG: radical SAM protein [Thermodesulfobacteriota bacterium]